MGQKLMRTLQRRPIPPASVFRLRPSVRREVVLTGSPPVAAQVDLRRQPVEDVLERVEKALHVRLDRQALVRKRLSLGSRTERGAWVRIERRGFERIGPQG